MKKNHNACGVEFVYIISDAFCLPAVVLCVDPAAVTGDVIAAGVVGILGVVAVTRSVYDEIRLAKHTVITSQVVTPNFSWHGSNDEVA